MRLFDREGRRRRTEALEPRGNGLFEIHLGGVGPGDEYTFVLDDQEVPDPYARFLPHGVHGPARVEARAEPPPRREFELPRMSRLVIYEMHLGAFTREGTWQGARAHLAYLADIGVSAIEVMPIAAFAGRRGWGYDGVALFAPHAAYGEPDDLRAFIADAHAHGLAVILDVVYNHFGPSGNYLPAYSPEYFTSAHKTAWGDAPAFGEPRLRRLVLSNARYWLEEMGFDGLRLDATHAIRDDSSRHIISEIAALAGGLSPRRLVFAEDERNEPRLIDEFGVDAIWADDFHHAVHVVMTGEQDGYYKAYPPHAQTLATTIERGWLYEGQSYPGWGTPRGKSAETLDASDFVYCIQNHDQVGNRAMGTRLGMVAGADAHCAAAMLLLFLHMVPLIFMGEEWGASSPFQFFTDHDRALGEAITRGRREEFARFAAFADPAVRQTIPDPQAESTFERSRISWQERDDPEHARVHHIYKRMLALRTTDRVFSQTSRCGLSCEVSGDLLIVRRSAAGETRALILNCGKENATVTGPLASARILLASVHTATQGGVPPRGALLLMQ